MGNCVFHLKIVICPQCFISTVIKVPSLFVLFVKLPCFGLFKCLFCCKCVFLCFLESGSKEGYKESTGKYKCNFKSEEPLAVTVRVNMIITQSDHFHLFLTPQGNNWFDVAILKSLPCYFFYPIHSPYNFLYPIHSISR